MKTVEFSVFGQILIFAEGPLGGAFCSKNAKLWLDSLHRPNNRQKNFGLDPRKMEVEMVHDVRGTFSYQNAQSGTFVAWWVHFK